LLLMLHYPERAYNAFGDIEQYYYRICDGYPTEIFRYVIQI